ncbi:MAG: hypothetical protein ACK4VI_04450 [Alphaproteobacteria bacterium]
MSRTFALGILWVFAGLFLAAAWWGLSDLRNWQSELEAGITPLVIDQSSFWMIGMAAAVILPFLGITSNVMAHRAIFCALILWGIGAPIISYNSFLARAEEQGYLIASGAQVLLLGEWELHLSQIRQITDDRYHRDH